MLNKLPLPKELIYLLEKKGSLLYYKKGNLLQSCEDYNNGICILLSGLVKISIEHDNKKMLLYHIDENNLQIMNFTNTACSDSNEIRSVVLEDATILKIPNELFLEWTSSYVELRDFMISSFQRHYIAIINRTQQFSSQCLEEYLLNYLKTKSTLYKSMEIKLPLNEISEDLNFSREAISRSLKKLELDHKIIRKARSIILLDLVIS